jgi:cytidine deaminase
MKKELSELLSNAYAPYSNYRVGAIVVTNDDKIFKGVNVENASYGGTICAERNAINTAITNGYLKGDFKALYLMNSSYKIGFPCFICRQTISEFFTGDEDLILYDINGKEKMLKIKDIISEPFTSENLR